MARRVVVEFVGDAGRYNKTVAGVENRTSRLGNAMKRAGKVAAIGLAAGAVVAAKGLYDMGKAAMEDQQSAKLLARSLHASAGATKAQVAQTEDWITAQGKAFGVADDDLRPALQKLVGATHDVGKAQKLASLAMDVSADRGISLETVAKTLARAQNGQVAGLSKLGVQTKNAAGETLSFTAIQKKMADQFGGAAATRADTLQGKMARLKLQLSETGEAIGYKLLPIAAKFADWAVNTAIPAVSRFTQELRAKLGPVIEWVRGLFGKNTDGMASDFSRNFANIKATIQSFVSIVQSLWARFGGTITATVRGALTAIRSIVGGQLNIIAGIFKTVAALLRGDWSGVWAGLKQIARGAVQTIKGIVGLLWSGIKGIFRAAGIALKGIFAGIWNGMKSLARSGINGILAAIKGVPAKIRGYAGMWKSAGAALIKGFVSGMKNAAGIISGIAGNVWSSIKSLLNRAIDKINSHLRIHIGLPGKDINFAANIPHLYKGGIVPASSGGSLVVAGDRGHREAIVPLDGPYAPKGGKGDVHLHFTFNGVIDADAAKIRAMLLREKRLIGTELGLS